MRNPENNLFPDAAAVEPFINQNFVLQQKLKKNVALWVSRQTILWHFVFPFLKAYEPPVIPYPMPPRIKLFFARFAQTDGLSTRFYFAKTYTSTRRNNPSGYNSASWRNRKVDGQDVVELLSDLAGTMDGPSFNGTLPLDYALRDYPPASTDSLLATQEFFNDRVIIAGDPGLVNTVGLVMSLGTVSDEEYTPLCTKRLVSSKSVYERTGDNHFRDQREANLPENVRTAQNNLSVQHPRVMERAPYIEYNNAFIDNFETLHQDSVSDLLNRNKSYAQKEQYFEILVLEILAQARDLHRRAETEMVKKPVFILGDCKMESIKRKRASHAGTLLKVLKRHFLVITLDEYNTSKRCSKCHGYLEDLPGTHRIKRCDNEACQSTITLTQERVPFLVNRDVSAPVNMVYVLLHMLRYGRRPESFQRPERRAPEQRAP
jgi:hypothetical protein